MPLRVLIFNKKRGFSLPKSSRLSYCVDLSTDRKFWTRTWRKDDSRSFYGEDFELVPAKFAEYYEEVLCAPD